MVVLNSDQDETIKSEFEEQSVLKFKYEHEKARSLVLLDTVVTSFQTDFHTGVYTKNTNADDCINYQSETQKVIKLQLSKLSFIGATISHLTGQLLTWKSKKVNSSQPAKTFR